MSKRSKKKTIKKEQKSTPSSVSNNAPISPENPWYKWMVFGVAFLLYANTLGHDYTQDDAIVIYDNMYTQQGFAGIPGLLSKDTFYGFFKTEGKSKLVSGGRYRPLTPVMFAIEYQLFGKNPFVGHLLNVLLYGLLCLFIYKTLVLLLLPRFGQKGDFYLFALLTSLLFAVHPIHTEAVANIKGRDEIMSMMGAVLGLYFTLKYIDKGSAKNLVFIFLAFFLGLMSKETTITYLAIIPLSVYFFREKLSLVSKPLLVALGTTIIFLIIRSSILGMDFGGAPMELMNNPYLKIEGNSYVPFSFAEKAATILFTLGKYVLLLFVPHPLTHDYYPRYIDMMSFGNWQVILSGLLYVGMLFYALRGLKTKKISSFCILYFLITLSIVSNIVFPIGTNMSERFMFMPSLGFCVLLPGIIYAFWDKLKPKHMVFALLPIIGAYSIKTVIRNFDWKDDFTLFTTDVKTSTNSAKVLNAAGGALVTRAGKTEDETAKNKMLSTAIPYLTKALTIHPNYKNAALLLGNANYFKGNFEEAVKAYERAISISPNYEDASRNLAVALRDGGRQAGEKEGNIKKAKEYLHRSLQLSDSDPETYRLLGITYGVSGDHENAIKYFEKVIEIEPKNASGYVNLGKAYQNYGDEESGMIMFQKAIQIDPKALEK